MPWPSDRSNQPVCLVEAGWREAEAHKWTRSCECGHDLGEAALVDWERKYWRYFCRIKRLAHLSGEIQFRQFCSRQFGILPADRWANHEFLSEVVRRFLHGMENLEFVLWMQDCEVDGRPIPEEQAFELFMLLDPNCTRLNFRRSPALV